LVYDRALIHFQTLYYIVLCLIRDMNCGRNGCFQCSCCHLQMNDILTLRAEVKHLSLVAHQLEPYVKALAASERNQASSDVIHQQQQQETTSSHQQLQSLLEHISMLQFDAASS